jgi:hypothetical protein
MNASITTSKPAPEAGPKTTPIALATKALEDAKGRGHTPADAIHVARKKLWDARWRSVLAGDQTMADLWIDALSYLGDKGAKRAVADRAAAAAAPAKGGRA